MTLQLKEVKGKNLTLTWWRRSRIKKKTLELASKWFRYYYSSPYLLSPIIFSAVNNLWCLLMSGYKRIWFAKP